MNSNNITINGLFIISLIFCCISEGFSEDVNTPLEILWQKEIDCGEGLSCSPGSIAINKDNNDLFITGTSFRPAINPMDYSEGKLWLWKINVKDATVSKAFLEDTPEFLKTQLDNATKLVKGLRVCSDGDILTFGSFGGEKHSVLKANTKGARKYLKPVRASENIVEPNIPGSNANNDEYIIILKQVDLPKNNLLLIGKNNKDEGLVIKVDAQGNIIWKRIYKLRPEMVDLFTDGIPIGNKGDFLLAGCSTNIAGKLPSEPSFVCLVLCDSEGNVMFKKMFQGNSWPSRVPQLCKIGFRDNFVLTYDRSVDMRAPEVMLEAFSPELTSQWKKLIDKPEISRPLGFKIKSASHNNFVVGRYIGSGRVTISEYDEQGNRQGMSTVDNILHNFSLDCTEDKAFLVAQTSPEIANRTSKIIVFAFGLKNIH